jgi:hypothetical protein
VHFSYFPDGKTFGGNFGLQAKRRSLVSPAIFPLPVPVTHDPSRKAFFARLLGAAAVFGFFPRLFAKPGTAQPSQPAPASPIAVRPEPRAVARRESVR